MRDRCLGWAPVIAATTSSGVVSACAERRRPGGPRPQDDDAVRDLEHLVQVVRDDDDPRPCSRRRLISASTCAVCATPSAAVGSSRMTTFASTSTAREIATDWRWPPESDGDPLPYAPDGRHAGGRSSTSSERFSISSSWSGPTRRLRLLAAEEHVRDDVEVVAEGEILVDGRDPEPRCVAGGVDLHFLAVDEGRPWSGRCAPEMHLISVDLPAPLSPTSATTSPGTTSKSTSVSA